MAKDTISNFIYISDKVLLIPTDESDLISHDIPFRNAHTGSIKLTITAKSPIFIRNHYVNGDDFYLLEKEDDNNQKITTKISKEFCHHNKLPYIPASSIKGMIRNTLEIFSYGKIQGKTKEEYVTSKLTDKTALHRDSQLDLSETIFGTTQLKGRVFFSHFKSINYTSQMRMKTTKEILMTPEAKKDKFGWKNYPILDRVIGSKKGNNENVISEFNPIKEGIKFEGYLRFHNLRDFELGALLSAISFHNTSVCHHNIGLAKSLGYGKININFDYEYTSEMLQSFEEKMNVELFEGEIQWNKSEYIKEIVKKHSNDRGQIRSLSNEKKVMDSYNLLLGKRKQLAEDEWQKIESSNKKSDFFQFAQKFPTHEQKAHDKINALTQQEEHQQMADEEWKKTVSSNDKTVFEKYSSLYPEFYIQEIQERLTTIIEQENQLAKEKLKQEEAKQKAVSSRGKVNTTLSKKILKRKKLK